MMLIIAMNGHTAAGKTSAARMLAHNLDADYISVGALKRGLRRNYKWQDSLDETLRDQAYMKAIAECSIGSCRIYRILDASFHRRYRRDWLYRSAQKSNASLIWVQCQCSSLSEVKRRLTARQNVHVKTAENHAYKIEIYEHIVRTSDPLQSSELPVGIESSIISIDTAQNSILYTTVNGHSAFVELHNRVVHLLEDYLMRMTS